MHIYKDYDHGVGGKSAMANYQQLSLTLIILLSLFTNPNPNWWWLAIGSKLVSAIGYIPLVVTGRASDVKHSQIFFNACCKI